MKKKSKTSYCSIALPAALIMMTTASAVHAGGTASLTSSSFTETFDSMGASGIAAPLGWSLLQGNSGTSNSTWQASTNNNGFNAALSASNTADRVLATSPTSISGDALQLTLRNSTGGSFSSLLVSYDTVRFTTADPQAWPGCSAAWA